MQEIAHKQWICTESFTVVVVVVVAVVAVAVVVVV